MGSADQRGITLWACITILSGNIIPIYISSDLKIFGLDKKGRRSTWVNIGTKCAATGGKQVESREIMSRELNGGKACPALSQEVDCNTHACKEFYRAEGLECPAPYVAMDSAECKAAGTVFHELD